MIKPILFIIVLFLGKGVFADLPIDLKMPLDWRSDIKTLSNEADKEIYYWDILALLTPVQLPSVNGKRAYQLRPSCPDSEELLEMMKGLQGALMHLGDGAIEYLKNAENAAHDPAHQTHIRRLRYICEYLSIHHKDFERGVLFDDEGDLDYWIGHTELKKVQGGDKKFLESIHTYTLEPAHRKALFDNYEIQDIRRVEFMSESDEKLLDDWRSKNGLVPSPFNNSCTYENLVKNPLWTNPPMSTRDSNNARVQNFTYTHYLDDLWSFKVNSDGIYVSKDGVKVKLITVFGSPDTFEDPSRHINRYGFLSNYWSTVGYGGKNYTLPTIQGAISVVRITVQKINGLSESYDFDHTEGAFHYAKLLLAGYAVDGSVYSHKSPYDTQKDAAKTGVRPTPDQVREWNKLMFELLKQKFTRNIPLKNELKVLKDATLIEGNNRGQNTDKNWGVEYIAGADKAQKSLTTGDNKLGRMLMEIARQLDSVPDDMEINETIIEEYTPGQYRVVSGRLRKRV
ncbi:MAG: NADAR family protein [Alphaproteobacteria bacterium]|nr:NADAR family protein [Alphaproteobacteria bacterium]